MSQAGTKSSAGSVVESTQRFDNSVRSFRIFYSPVNRGAQVFEGTDILSDETCIIKVLKPVSEKKIKREVQTHPFTRCRCDVYTHQQIKVLRNISGGPNIVALLDVVRDTSHTYHSLVMEYVDNTDWKVLLRSMNELDMKYYMFQLLKVRFSDPTGVTH